MPAPMTTKRARIAATSFSLDTRLTAGRAALANDVGDHFVGTVEGRDQRQEHSDQGEDWARASELVEQVTTADTDQNGGGEVPADPEQSEGGKITSESPSGRLVTILRV